MARRHSSTAVAAMTVTFSSLFITSIIFYIILFVLLLLYMYSSHNYPLSVGIPTATRRPNVMGIVSYYFYTPEYIYLFVIFPRHNGGRVIYNIHEMVQSLTFSCNSVFTYKICTRVFVQVQKTNVPLGTIGGAVVRLVNFYYDI